MDKDDNKQVMRKRDALNARLQEKYPDKDFSDDEVFYGQISDDSDAQLGGYRDREKSFSDMFTSDPRSANFILDWRNGEDPTIGLIRRFGPEIKDAIDNPALLEQISAANKEYVERLEESKRLESEYEKNISETLSYLDELSKSGELQESEIDDAMELLTRIVHDGIVGKFLPETISMAVKALKHDIDVEEADREGEVRGRNAKIEEMLRKGQKGDGTAVLDGKNSGSGQLPVRSSIFELASEAR